MFEKIIIKCSKMVFEKKSNFFKIIQYFIAKLILNFLFFFKFLYLKKKSLSLLYWESAESYNWHKNSKSVDGIINSKNKLIFEKTKNFLKKKKSFYFIDIGCGFGDYLNLISKENLIGLDLSKKVLNEAKTKYPNIKFFQGTLRDNMLEINKLIKNDIVIFNYIKTLKHLDRKMILNEFLILKKLNFKRKYLIINDLQISENLISKKIDNFTYHHNYSKIIKDFGFQIIYKNVEITKMGNQNVSMIVKII